MRARRSTRPWICRTRSSRRTSPRSLKREGFIQDFTAKEARVGQTLEITLKYGPNGERSIQGIKRISKPGLRRYAKSDALPMPLGGLGIAIISTSSGLLTQKECLDRGIGGEIVAYVW